MNILKIALLGSAALFSGAALASTPPQGSGHTIVSSYAAPEGTGQVGDTASYAAPEGNGHVGDTASYAAPEGNANSGIG
jgi:hypothetical protein